MGGAKSAVVQCACAGFQREHHAGVTVGSASGTQA